MTAREKKQGKVVIGLLLAALVGIVGYMLWHTDSAKAEEATSSSSSTPTPSPTASANCEDQYVQTPIHDEVLFRFVEGGIDAATVQEATANMLGKVGHSVTYLHIIADKAFGLSDVPPADQMVTENCLNKEGIGVLQRLKDVTSASGQEFAPAPDSATNSGVDANGNPVIDSTPGLRGNLKAIKYTLPNGSVVYILVRCGNPVFPSAPPGIPPGKTDNPEPPPPSNPGKNPLLDVLRNNAVDDYKKDGPDRHTVSTGNGAEVANGVQHNPAADAAKAAADAAAKQRELDQQHQDAQKEAPVVDTNQENGAVAPPSD